MKTLFKLLIVLALPGCAIPTTIKSRPEGATVYIDNRNVGKTPLTYSDTEIIFSHKDIRVEMSGYKSFVGTIKKDKLKVGPLIGACFAGVPVLWMLGYDEEYSIDLERGHTSLPKKEVSINKPLPEEASPKAEIRPAKKNPEPVAISQKGSVPSTSNTVITSTTKLRKRPFKDAKVISTLKKGLEVQVIKEKDGWCLIEISGGETGWCLRKFLTER